VPFALGIRIHSYISSIPPADGAQQGSPQLGSIDLPDNRMAAESGGLWPSRLPGD
jgi:hypothetical protein